MLLHVLSLAPQIILMWLILRASAIRSTNALYSFYNPFGFLILFYTLFFLLPQLYGLTADFEIIGLDQYPIRLRSEIFLNTQLMLSVFLAFIYLGQLLTLPLTRRPRDAVALLQVPQSRLKKLFLWSCFLIGLAATLYLGETLTALETARSELVKTTQGRVLTAISFYSNFAYCVLLFRALQKKQYFLAAALFFAYGFAVTLTGARGRFLWPTVIAFVLLSTWRNIAPGRKHFILACVTLLVLVSLDPLRAAILDPTRSFGSSVVLESLANIFIKRNFDGFANFALVISDGAVKYRLGYLFTGARDVFMNTYYPAIYASGVGFGVTIPGWFYLSGGLVTVMVCSTLYGAALGLINAMVRKLRTTWGLYGYLFAIIWLAAVGGNFVESVDKMIIAMSPAFIPLTARIFRARRQRHLSHA